MPIMLPADPIDTYARDPRAQFFANRAYAHAYAITSFEQIQERRKTVRIEAKQPLVQKPRAPIIEM